ncbi:MAG: efflux RND transporter periplasmic adaptor subunit [Pseudomonadota bacterium]
MKNASKSLLCVSILTAISACEQAAVPEPPLRPVKSLLISAADYSVRKRVFSGTTQASQEVDLSFRVKGTVVELPISVGSKVEAGVLLAALDDETYRVELAQAKADLAQATASRRSAEADYQRIRQLYANDNASRTELDESLASAEASRADVDALSQALRRAELDLSYTRLRADAECSVASVDVELNENVNAGALVAKLNCGRIWEVVIDVPESQIGAFEPGMEGEVSLASVKGVKYPAAVSEIGVASVGNASFPVTLVLEAFPETIRSNLAAEAELSLTDRSSNAPVGAASIMVPAAAVSQDELGTFVYLVEPTEDAMIASLRRQDVSVGVLTEFGLEIVAGLTTGDVVLTAGHANARDGMHVRQP